MPTSEGKEKVGAQLNSDSRIRAWMVPFKDGSYAGKEKVGKEKVSGTN